MGAYLDDETLDDKGRCPDTGEERCWGVMHVCAYLSFPKITLRCLRLWFETCECTFLSNCTCTLSIEDYCS